MEKKDYETKRIIITNQNNHGTRILPIPKPKPEPEPDLKPDPKPDLEPDLERYILQEEELRRRKNRQTVISVWILTAVLFFAAGGLLLWKGDYLGSLLSFSPNGKPISDESSSAKVSQPKATQPKATQPRETQPKATQPKATQPKATQPRETQPKATQPKVTQPEADSEQAAPVGSSTAIELPALAGDVAQVEVWQSDMVAVLRTDGTVDVAGNSALASKVASWNHVVKIYVGYGSIAAIKDDGTAICTLCDLSGWTDIEDIYLWDDGVAGIKTGGTVVTAGTWDEEYDPSGWKNIKKLYNLGENTTIGLRQDGTIVKSGFQEDRGESKWNKVEELYPLESYNFCARLSNGSFVSLYGKDLSGLKGCKKIVMAGFSVFGISSDGRLHTESGRLYSDGSAHMNPEYSEYIDEISLSQYRNIKDITGGPGIIVLKNDGTVDGIGFWADWDFSIWNQIEKIYTDWYGHAYGLRRDGSVVMANTQDGTNQDNYMGWNLKELFINDFGGAVGLTHDGKLVGDGAFSGNFLDNLN